MEDFLLLDDQLTDEERLTRDTVHRLVQDEYVPIVTDAYEKAVFPTTFIPKLAQLGVLGMTLPKTYGCAHASHTAYGLTCQELERGDSGLRSFFSVQSALCMFPIFAYGSEEQKKQFLPRMAKAELIGCFGLTEPDSGSDPSSMKTTAKKTDKGWILNGSKMWISNATLADVAIVWAKTTEGIRGFMVERDFPGFTASPIHHKGSLRASDTGELAFNDCFVPNSHYLPQSTCGLSAPLSCLSKARLGIAWGAMGAAQACFDIALNYVKERKQFNKPLAAFQLIQTTLATMFAEITKTQTFNLQLARLADHDKATPIMISMGKMNACRTALAVARECRNLLGANGISLEYHVIRHMANLESVFTYEGTDNIHHLIIGKHLTGIDAFN